MTSLVFSLLSSLHIGANLWWSSLVSSSCVAASTHPPRPPPSSPVSSDMLAPSVVFSHPPPFLLFLPSFTWLRRVWCPPWVDRVPRAESPMPRVSRRSRNSRARFGCHVTIGLGLGALHRLLQLALSRTPLGSRVLVSSRALASQMECSQLSTSPALR